MPKGVMLSHDSKDFINYLDYIWTSITVIKKYKKDEQKERIVSYLPLSHVAAQIIDIIGTVYSGTHVYFATPDALQGSLVETLREVRPTFFFSVPRVWEKIEEKMK
jgi:long-chain-fatty-acid--CoA ligase ACSBG